MPTRRAAGRGHPSTRGRRRARGGWRRRGGWIGLLPPEVDADLSRVVDASLATASRRAYRADGTGTARAIESGYPCLPGPPAVVAAYVTAAAAEQRPNGAFAYAPATLTCWVSSINQVHAAANLDPPGGRSWSAARWPGPPDPQDPTDPAGTAAARGHPGSGRLARTGGRRLAGGVAACRDTALLLMGFAGAF